MPDLSVIIPARNEMWLGRTVDDVRANLRGDTEVIVVLDGAWPEPGLPQHANLHVLYLPEPVGQRAATNLGAKVSEARYVMKLDAHCAVGEGFDVELVRTGDGLGPDVTQVPTQYNLHVFDRICARCGRREYQGPTDVDCVTCGPTTWTKEVVWNAKRRLTASWRFDADLHFQYFGEYQKRPEVQGEVYDVMSCLGACWFMSREHFWQLGGLDEAHGSWGQMGTEIACKSWLSGGRLVCNRRTWFSHMFRTQGGDFGFPYPISGADQKQARERSRQLWIDGTWGQAVRPLSWLVNKFWPVPGWTEEQRDALPGTLGTVEPILRRADVLPISGSQPAIDSATPDASLVGDSGWDHQRHDACRPAHSARSGSSAGIVYYTDNRLDDEIRDACLGTALATGLPFVAVSLKKIPGLSWEQNVVLDLERSYLTMFKQILTGLQEIDTEFVFFCEHDVAYHHSHFDFTPPNSTQVFYNQNVWKVDAETGRALHYLCSQTSGLCANRELLLEHYRKRVAIVESQGFSRKMGFEPGTHRRAERVDDLTARTWMSEYPNVDIRHGQNLTPSRWKKEQFRDQRYTKGWTEAEAIPGWGVTKGRFREFLREAAHGAVQQAVA